MIAISTCDFCFCKQITSTASNSTVLAGGVLVWTDRSPGVIGGEFE